MKAVLLLIAILLAWPTYGLSLVTFAVFAVSRRSRNSKLRIRNETQQRASRIAQVNPAVQNGERQMPSWAEIDRECHYFLRAIQEMCLKRGVPLSFTLDFLADNENFRDILFKAGVLEQRGDSFLFQQIVASREIEDMWRAASTPARR